jgi:hypothetical protein
MKKPCIVHVLILFIAVANGFLIFGQTTLRSYSCAYNRYKANKNGMAVLGSWAALNIGLGGYFSSNTNGAEQYFHQFNMGWNVINLGIALLDISKNTKHLPTEKKILPKIFNRVLS